MIRLACVADSHFDQLSRFEECIRLHDWIAEDAEARGVDGTLHAGDVYERKSTPDERIAAARWFQRMARLGPVVVDRGNHDAIGDLPLLERLEAKHPISVFEHVGMTRVAGVALGVLGWPQRGNVHLARAAFSHDDVEVAAGDALRDVLRGFGAWFAKDPTSPRILLAHAMVRGSRVSTGQPLVGCDFEIGIEDLALAHADCYVLGHVHKGQRWDIAGAPCIYPGSPRRTAFGELEPKGYVVAEIEGHEVECTFVEAPATPMIQLAGSYADGVLERDVADVRGAEVRLRYRVRNDERAAARAAAEGARTVLVEIDGAASVKLEEMVEAEQRARVPEVARAASIPDKLQALWTSKGFDPGERSDALIGKVIEIEQEVHHAT